MVRRCTKKGVWNLGLCADSTFLAQRCRVPDTFFVAKPIGNGGGNEVGQLRRTDSPFYLQPLRRHWHVLIMRFPISIQLTKEKLFFRGQFHPAVRTGETRSGKMAAATRLRPEIASGLEVRLTKPLVNAARFWARS